MGTQVPYGNSYDYTNNWSVLFQESVPNFDEYCFSTYDFSKWLRCTKDTVMGTYTNADANIISSSNNNLIPHWYNRKPKTSHAYDPLITIGAWDNGSQGIDVLYAEGSYNEDSKDYNISLNTNIPENPSPPPAGPGLTPGMNRSVMGASDDFLAGSRRATSSSE